MLEIEVLTFLKDEFGNMNVAEVTGNPNKLIDFLKKNGVMDTYLPIVEKLMQKQSTRSSQQLHSATTLRSAAAFIGQHSTPKSSTRCEAMEDVYDVQDEPIDYSIKSREFDVVKRSDYIGLNSHQRKRKSIAPMKAVIIDDLYLRSPSPLLQTPRKKILPVVGSHPMLMSWKGESIYENLPQLCIGQFNKILISSFNLKVKVLTKLNQVSPVKYDYNEKKSMIRTSYDDEQIALDRIKNNIASRRSRHRKKFKNNVKHNAVNFDKEETLGIDAQIENMKRFITDLEQEIFNTDESSLEKIMDLRAKCGLV